ncbi:CRTAC1 family protein, partial [Malonomonas rubra]|uniref:CRTAC1 family protein n=1 Tax=Malonomonas rubra TaxID=57040 RepID=UPI0026EC7C1F
NRLYLNNGNGTFREVSREAGVDDRNWGLGASFADIDNDGDLDLFVSNYVGRNGLYLNDGTGKFTDVSEQVKNKQQGWGKGPAFGDIDHDGDLDLYEGDCKLANQLYLNDGKGMFTDIAGEQPQLQCATVRTKGTAFADVDNDGDLDLYVVNWGAENKLYLNQQNDNNWLKVKAVGSGSNKDAIGTRIELYNGDQLLAVREVGSATGFCAQEPLVQHFGVKAGDSYRVKGLFPSGKEVIQDDIRTGQILRIEEPN